MERTSQSTTDTLQEPQQSAAHAAGWSEQLQEIARAASRQGNDLEAVGAFVLECLIEILGFERGFFLAEALATDDGFGASGEISFEVLSSRLHRQRGGESSWVEVPSPEFALNRSVVKRAFASPDVLQIDDCLIQPSADVDVEGQRRAVLCRSFLLSEEARGLVVLERAFGLEPIGDAQRDALALFVDWCTPVFGKTYLWREVERLRAQVTSLESERDGGDEPEAETDVAEIESLPSPDDLPPAYYGLLGTDPKIRKIAEVAEKVKDSDLNICVFGESGTGKELVARAIHAAGNRAEQPFVSENCGAISENLLESELFGHVKGAFTGADDDRQGLFELADKGTLFLDEIGDMSEGMQRKLLRALQEGVIRPIGSKESIHVDVRVVCASNRDLKYLVQKGEFRADLYYRLNVIAIQVPPLRERRGDIPVLLSRFAADIMEEEGVRKRFSASAVRALVQYGWPGNVRELSNVIRRVLLTSTRRVIARKDVLPFLTGGAQGAACLGENLERDDDHLILRIPTRRTFNEIVDECERLVLLNALKENGWNKSRVTKVLGIPRQSLYNKIARYDLSKD